MIRTSHTQTLAVLTLFGLVFGGCTTEETTEKVEPVRPAKLVTVSAAGNQRTFHFPAIVNAATSAELTFSISGQIERFDVVEGDQVTRGQIVAQLNQRQFRNDVSTAQSNLDSAQSEFERAERLIAENAISRSIFEQRETARNVAQDQFDSAQKALDDTVLRTAFDGVIAAKHAKELDVIQPSQSIVTLQTLGAAEAVAQIPASLVARAGSITPLSTDIILDAAPDEAIPAEVKSTTAMADEATQTFEVRFSFTPPARLQILPGMTGTIRSVLSMDDGGDKQLSVPLASVMTNGEERYVWLVDTDSMTVSRRDIVIGAGVGESLSIRSGLVAGDTIVAAGASYLHDGVKIRAYE